MFLIRILLISLLMVLPSWAQQAVTPGAAEAVAYLAHAGVSVARCEPVKLSLADLLERVLARHAATNA